MEGTLQALLGHHAAAACCCPTEGDPATLAPAEYGAVASAVAKRQKEFAAGRTAARRAMHRLGHPAAPVVAAPDRSPCWPAGLVGSITHCQTTCIAVVALHEHSSSVGVDVEPDQGLSDGLWELVCRPEELRQLARWPEAVRARWVTRLFCAKEAYYKWVFPRIRSLLDFQDVAIEMGPELEGRNRFVVHPLRQDARESTPPGLAGTITTTQDVVVSLVMH